MEGRCALSLSAKSLVSIPARAAGQYEVVGRGVAGGAQHVARSGVRASACERQAARGGAAGACAGQVAACSLRVQASLAGACPGTCLPRLVRLRTYEVLPRLSRDAALPLPLRLVLLHGVLLPRSSLLARPAW